MKFRSHLFVPGDRPERFDKAVAAGADITILDLEDAVLPDAKDKAREAIGAWLGQGNRAAIRINPAGTQWHEADAELAAHANVTAVMLPKAETGEALAAFAARLRPGAAILPLVESALGVWNALEIAKAPGVRQIAFGTVDFQLDAGIDGEDEDRAFLYARSRLVLASAIARIAPPADGVTIALDDEARLAADVAAARALGFGGKLCIHPRQVAAVNEGFSPSEAETEKARRIVEAAEAAGAGAIRLDGKLIDKPVVERAKRTLANVG
jgi:citrate lyase subunit beta / citryl-CoA lyase